jgi:hypothetical protein
MPYHIIMERAFDKHDCACVAALSNVRVFSILAEKYISMVCARALNQKAGEQ